MMEKDLKRRKGTYMEWESRVKRYLEFFGFEFLGVDGCYVFWKDRAGKVWNSPDTSINFKMNVWENGIH